MFSRKQNKQKLYLSADVLIQPQMSGEEKSFHKHPTFTEDAACPKGSLTLDPLSLVLSLVSEARSHATLWVWFTNIGSHNSHSSQCAVTALEGFHRGSGLCTLNQKHTTLSRDPRPAVAQKTYSMSPWALKLGNHSLHIQDLPVVSFFHSNHSVISQGRIYKMLIRLGEVRLIFWQKLLGSELK